MESSVVRVITVLFVFIGECIVISSAKVTKCCPLGQTLHPTDYMKRKCVDVAPTRDLSFPFASKLRSFSDLDSQGILNFHFPMCPDSDVIEAFPEWSQEEEDKVEEAGKFFNSEAITDGSFLHESFKYPSGSYCIDAIVDSDYEDDVQTYSVVLYCESKALDRRGCSSGVLCIDKCCAMWHHISVDEDVQKEASIERCRMKRTQMIFEPHFFLNASDGDRVEVRKPLEEFGYRQIPQNCSRGKAITDYQVSSHDGSLWVPEGFNGRNRFEPGEFCVEETAIKEDEEEDSTESGLPVKYQLSSVAIICQDEDSVEDRTSTVTDKESHAAASAFVSQFLFLLPLGVIVRKNCCCLL